MYIEEENGIFEFSCITQSILENVRLIKTDYLSLSGIDFEDVRSDAVKELEGKKFLSKELPIMQKNNLAKWSIKSIVCQKKKFHKSNHVYFIYNLNSSIIRQKCFDCGRDVFYDIKIPT
ncbi:hypothetical protein QAD02_003871 [Eretmocerus hayati]|uniref:Uncharacterized protein n=1 Tax=Eretmocerus hayati TaxID=131215 RepID=A0ACC2NQS1_9HYME|nr:hypothetical protein QAD02_003871 [Eretmocerus hayati]